MSRPKTALCVALLCAVACGGSSPAPKGPAAAAVAVQTADLPRGMVQCDLTGDISHFIQKEQGPDPKTAQSAATSWAQEMKNGATAAYVAVYADSAADCSSIKSSTSNITAGRSRVIINFVIQFKDEKSAVSAYKNDSIFETSAASLRAGSQAIEGTQTGLTPNSIVVSQAIPPQTFYVALWQIKAFVVEIVVLNVDLAASKKIAISENSRIK